MSEANPSQATVRERRALLATCVAAAVQGSAIVREGAANLSRLTWEVKTPADFVSEVDRGSEAAIARVVAERHPEARLIGEELSPEAASDLSGLTFVVDPLDGTTNFLHGFPWYAISIAAVIDGAPVAGVVLNVANGELFTATLGGGARRAGEAIAVSTQTDPMRALIGTGFPFKNHDLIPIYMESLPRIMAAAAGIRRPGAAALDLTDVACGRFDGFWELMLAPWDVAAGILIAREAGGVVTDLDGLPAPVAHGSIVAGNPGMHAWLMGQLSESSS